MEVILAKVKSGEISIEQALQELCETGSCPNLLNDDDGRWALVFDGFQDLVIGDKAQDINTSFFVEARYWKDTIKEAVIYSLTED